MAVNSRLHCLGCLNLGLATRLDKFGRPYLRCEFCKLVVFSNDTSNIFQVVAIAELLTSETVRSQLREQKVAKAANPGATVYNLVAGCKERPIVEEYRKYAATVEGAEEKVG